MRDCLVIGAGQAGLAVSFHLAARGIPSLALEGHPRVGDVWRRRWAGLRLFTPGRYNALPGSPFPGPRYGLPDRLAVADYLEAYAGEHALDVRTDRQATAIEPLPAGAGFSVATDAGETFAARTLVVAAGAYRTPRKPGFAERLPPGLPAAHSSEIADPARWLPGAGRHVLVVGAGASGTQLAQLLSRHHRVTLAGRDPGHLPRRILGRDVYDLLYGTRLLRTRVDSPAGRLLARAPTGGEIRVGRAVDALAAEAGIARVARIADFDGAFHTAEGTVVPGVDAVVFATGYRNAYPMLSGVPGALTADGSPAQRLGRSGVPGLWWVGLHLMRRINSSLLGGVGRDAREIADEVAAYLRRAGRGPRHPPT